MFPIGIVVLSHGVVLLTLEANRSGSRHGSSKTVRMFDVAKQPFPRPVGGAPGPDPYPEITGRETSHSESTV